MKIRLKKIVKSVTKAVSAPVRTIAKVVTGPVGSVVTGILNKVGVGGISPVFTNPLQLAGAIQGAFQSLFQRERASEEVEAPPRPLPFRPPTNASFSQLPVIGDVLRQALARLTSLSNGGAAGVSALPGALDQVLKQLPQLASSLAGLPSAAPSPSASASSSLAASGGKVDSMMKEAERLMLSENKADQLRGQRMMMDAQNLFQMLSQLLKAQSDMQRAAIGNLRG